MQWNWIGGILITGALVIASAACRGSEHESATRQPRASTTAAAVVTDEDVDAVCRALGRAMIAGIQDDLDEMGGTAGSREDVATSQYAQVILALDAIGTARTDELAEDLKTAANPSASEAASIAVSDWCGAHNFTL